MNRRSFLRLLGLGAIAAPNLIRSRCAAPAPAYGDYSRRQIGQRGPRWGFKLDASAKVYTPVFY